MFDRHKHLLCAKRYCRQERMRFSSKQNSVPAMTVLALQRADRRQTKFIPAPCLFAQGKIYIYVSLYIIYNIYAIYAYIIYAYIIYI